MFKRIVCVLFSCLLIFSMAIPTFAAETDGDTFALPSDGVMSWTIGENTYELFFGSYRYYNNEDRYQLSLVVPMYYCTDGISTMIFTNGSYTVSNSYTRYLLLTENGTVIDKFDVASYSNEVNSGVYTSFSNNTTISGLSFASVSSLQSTLDYSKTALYYVEDELTDLSTAENIFSVVDDSGGGGTVTPGGGSFTQNEKNVLFELLSSIANHIENIANNIGSYFSDLDISLGSRLDKLIELFEMDGEGETTGRNFWDMIASVFDTVFGGFFDTVSDLAKDVTDFFTNFTTNVTTLLETVFSEFFETVRTISTNITDFFTTFFTELFNTIENVVRYLFVPPAGYFDGKVTEFKEQVPFVGVVSDFSEEFFGYFERQGYAEAPAITVDLSLAEGKYNYGFGHVTILDLSWYGRYKPFVDMFLSTILWITYLWLLYKRLPDIIYGAGAITESAAQFSGVNVEYETAKYRREYRRSHHK